LERRTPEWDGKTANLQLPQQAKEALAFGGLDPMEREPEYEYGVYSGAGPLLSENRNTVGSFSRLHSFTGHLHTEPSSADSKQSKVNKPDEQTLRVWT
jgi:hypothetical protein